MKRNCRVLDKVTGQNFDGQIDDEVEHCEWYSFVDISDKEPNKTYIWKDGEVVEKPVNLTELRSQKLTDNTKAKDNKEFISTSVGKVKMQTPVGRVDVMAGGFVNVTNITQAKLPAGSFRIYDISGLETESPELSMDQVGQFYLSVFNAFNIIDKRFKEYEAVINAAETQSDLDNIKIDYSDI